jgi:hypothetical protein
MGATVMTCEDGLASRLASFLADIGPLKEQWASGSLPVDPTRLTTYLADANRLLLSARSRGEMINICDVAGLRRNEVRNAAVLAFFLKPHGTHGFGHAILEAFLKRALGESKVVDSVGSLENAAVVAEECPLGSDRDRVDISITAGQAVIFIEVKIDAQEGDQQLKRYIETAQAKAISHGKAHSFVVFLTLKRQPHCDDGIASATWRDVARILQDASRSVSGLGRELALSFAQHVNNF